ncbi:MAG: peptidase metallopeptidase [Frankiales bacterium]|nr:peptidase metallopeptidase [Frankiales bacterium]
MVRRLLLVLASLAALGAVPATPALGLHLSDADAVTVGMPSSATGASYAFETLLQGRPVRWDPCTAIHWRYRTSGQVVGGFTQVVKAIVRISRATGTTWVYDGAVTTAPTTSWLPKSSATRPPVLIGWATAARSDLLSGQSPNVLGVTRMAWFGVTRDGTTTAAIRSAVVALNQGKHLPLTGPVSWYTVVLHELSHAMGLAHAGSASQLMYPVIQPGLKDLQPGDLTGLARVGRAQGCIRL